MLRHIRQLANDTLIYGAAGAIQSMLGLLVIPIYTRLLTAGDIGTLSITTSIVRLLSTFTVMGLDSAAGRWYFDTERDDDRKITIASWVWWQLGATLITATIVLLVAEPIASLTLGDPQRAIYIRLMALALLLGVFDAITNNLLRFQRRPWAVLAFSVIANIVQVGCAVGLIVWGKLGLLGIYYAQLGGAVCSIALTLFLVRGWLHPANLRLERLRPMLHYALPLVPAGLAFWVVNFADRYFVQYYTTIGDVGIYQIGSSLAATIGLVMAAFLQAWGPFYMSIHTQPEAKAVYANVFLIYLWVMCGLAATLALLAPEVLAIVTTKTYLGASTVVGYLALGYMMIGLVQIAAVGTTIMKRMRPTGVAYSVAAALNIVLNIVLVPRFGREGSAIATMIAFATMATYMFWAAQRVYPIPYRFGAGIAIIALAAALMGSQPLLPALDLWASVAVKLALLTLVFGALPFAVRIVSIQSLRGALSKVMP